MCFLIKGYGIKKITPYIIRNYIEIFDGTLFAF
jgi:hypothetical protein